MTPSWTKSAGILPLPLPGTAMSLRSRSSWRTRLGEVPRSWATSAGVSVSIGCEPMAPGERPTTVPGHRPGASGTPGLTRRSGMRADDPARARPRRAGGARHGARLPSAVVDYYAGGAEAEITLAEAPGAWRSWRLRPRVLRGGAEVRPVHLPARQRGARPRSASRPGPTSPSPTRTASAGCARGAAAAGALMTVSTSASTSLADVAATEPHCAEVVPALPPALPRPHRRPRPPGRAGRATGRWCSPSTCPSSADGCATWRTGFALPADLPLGNHPPGGRRCPPTPRSGPSTTSAGSPSCPGCRSWSRASCAGTTRRGACRPGRRRSGSPRTAAGRPIPWSPARSAPRDGRGRRRRRGRGLRRRRDPLRLRRPDRARAGRDRRLRRPPGHLGTGDRRRRRRVARPRRALAPNWRTRWRCAACPMSGPCRGTR